MSGNEKNSINIHRNELYKQVWKIPRSRLAEKYGISDVMLSKICRKLNVPTPSRGYWSKLEFRKKVERPPLPKIGPKDLITHTIHLKKISNSSSQTETKIPKIDSKQRTKVPKKIKSPHPLIEETRKVLTETQVDDYGVLRTWRRKYLDIRVSPKSLDRALRIMDTLIKQFDSKGFPVSTETGVYSKLPSTHVEIFGEKVHFSLNENVKRIDPNSSDETAKKNKNYSWREGHKWAYFTTGKLCLKINEYASCCIKKKFSDTLSTSVEDQLTDFYKCAVMIAEELKKRRVETEKEEKKFQEKQKRREEEEKLICDFENQAEQWYRTQKLRAYIQAVERIADSEKCSDEIRKRIEKWIFWAKKHADRIDPLSGIPLDDNPSDK